MSNTDAREPVSVVDRNTRGTTLEEGMALCLSGGGYRAMVFHLGTLIRLNEVGLLGKLKRVSSVSGGSITAAQLGLNWNRLIFNEQGSASNLIELVINPVLRLSSHTIDAPSILGGIFRFGTSVSDRITAAYREHLFGDATLQHLPADNEGPRFVINATNVQSGALWRFSRPYMGDYKVGRILSPTVSLATAVAASSAFPPVLSPLLMKLRQEDFASDPTTVLQYPPYTTDVVLTDGGVYDNLGLETAWKRFKTLLVSDGGGQLQPEERPKWDWPRHAFRINEIIDNQVRSLRKRQLISALKDPQEPHDGAYWSIRGHIRDYPHPGPLPCPKDRTQELASVATRLQKLDPGLRNRLVNWGYAICATAIGSHVAVPVQAEAKFPMPGGV